MSLFQNDIYVNLTLSTLNIVLIPIIIFYVIILERKPNSNFFFFFFLFFFLNQIHPSPFKNISSRYKEKEFFFFSFLHNKF